LLPNFLIAGVVASGTSYLSSTLAHHPDIYLPRIQRPEPNFFHYSWKFEKGIEWYQNFFFGAVGAQKAIGERSSLLLSSEVAAKRIKKVLPKVKLIFCLRNPIERAWANYRFTVLEGLENLDFQTALELESKRMKTAKGKWREVQPHAYVTRSLYSARLQEYFELFGCDQILVLKSEDLSLHPQENLKKVCEFLGVSSSVQLPPAPKYSSPSVRDPSVQMELRNYFEERFPDVIEYIRKEKGFSPLITNDEDEKKFALLSANLVDGVKTPLTNTNRQSLQKLLTEEIARLKDMLDFSIRDWV
jgi:hypothetical protein